MKNDHYRKSFWLSMLGFALLLLTGCAGSQGSIHTLQPFEQGTDLQQFSHLTIDLSVHPDIWVDTTVQPRLLSRIVRELRQHEQNHYATINDSASHDQTLVTALVLTDYDPGSAGLRFLLAGLGAIHIDGDLTFRNKNGSGILGVKEITKTFAWGGLYGGSMSIEDVEEGFVEAVAAALLEHDSDSSSLISDAPE